MNWTTALAPEVRSSYCRPDGLWTRADLARLGFCAVVGSAGLAFAWRGSAGEADWQDNSRWIVLGSASAALAVAGMILWLVCGRSRIVASQRVVRAALARRTAPPLSPRRETGEHARVSAAGMRRFHRPDCLLMVGKQPQPVDPHATPLRACEVCAS